MEHVYKSYYGLSEVPFNITPDPAFLYRSGGHREALAQLAYGIKARKGFVVLTGEVGTGKTTLIHSLLHDLGESSHTALLFSVISTPKDLLRWVCEEFRLIEPREARESIHDYLVLLNDFLLEKYRNDETCAVIVDEAQNLSAEVLESIRLLSNFETAKDKLLQIVLVGQPELSARLNSQELRQLKQRISLRYELRPLNSAETQEYITARLKVAGGDPGIFTTRAVEAIYRYSAGIPRLINVLGDNALLTGFALGQKRVDGATIDEVARDLSLASQVVPKPLPTSAAPVPPNGAGPTVLKLAPRAAPVRPASNSSADVTPVEGSVSQQQFEVVRRELIEAMGPMATVVLEETLRSLGLGSRSFPEKKLETLVRLVSEEVLDPSMREKFKQTVMPQIQRDRRKGIL